jgi:hypothetical protein
MSNKVDYGNPDFVISVTLTVVFAL